MKQIHDTLHCSHCREELYLWIDKVHKRHIQWLKDIRIAKKVKKVFDAQVGIKQIAPNTYTRI